MPLPINAEYTDMDVLKSEIAAAAARMVVEEGLEYGPAKRRAVKQLGLKARSALPDNDSLEEAVGQVEWIVRAQRLRRERARDRREQILKR